ncbi:hypothetical protein V5799_010913 [Amblyomma americanum]|uniref:Lipase domain-containing protein n=1 Tax=Amblyomma americanum TaxID=6943 RepID=A0AAQ4EIK3_AMBAM
MLENEANHLCPPYKIIVLVLSTCTCNAVHVSNWPDGRILQRAGESEATSITTVSPETAHQLETEGPTNLPLESPIVCYNDSLGCFRMGNLMTHSQGLPRNPESIGTKLTLFWKDTGGNIQSTSVNYMAPTSTIRGLQAFSTRKKLTILVHGFHQSENSPWIKDATTALANMGCNVLVVDWSKTHSLKNAEQSAKDTAMVARQLSVLVLKLLEVYPATVRPADIHAV